MNRVWPSLLIVLVSGCGRTRQFDAPTSPGAFECALREAEEIGYRRLEGSREAGVVRLGRYIPPPPAREPTDPEVRVSDVTNPRLDPGRFESQIRISERRGQLRIAVIAQPDPDAATAAAGGVEGDAQQILAQCAGSGPGR